MGLPAGAFRERVTIEQKSVARSAIGEESATWVTLATVWAAVEPLRGREFFAAAQMLDATDYRITIRYRSDVTRDMRVNWGGELMDITSVIDVRSRRENLELMCISGVRNGQ